MGCTISKDDFRQLLGRGSNRIATSSGKLPLNITCRSHDISSHTTDTHSPPPNVAIPLAWYASDDFIPSDPAHSAPPPLQPITKNTDTTLAPPPYTESAEDGHVTLMRSPIDNQSNQFDSTSSTLNFSIGLPPDMYNRSTMELLTRNEVANGNSLVTIATDTSTTEQVERRLNVVATPTGYTYGHVQSAVIPSHAHIPPLRPPLGPPRPLLPSPALYSTTTLHPTLPSVHPLPWLPPPSVARDNGRSLRPIQGTRLRGLEEFRNPTPTQSLMESPQVAMGYHGNSFNYRTKPHPHRRKIKKHKKRKRRKAANTSYHGYHNEILDNNHMTRQLECHDGNHDDQDSQPITNEDQIEQSN